MFLNSELKTINIRPKRKKTKTKAYNRNGGCVIDFKGKDEMNYTQ